ncbi:MAG TPA: GDSL-type esterase/lipase family protein [Tepidisphaeraceae bacterium]|jgi:lysophospholipase L1-like esterase|nr:GDSL-type esterase/lipase family protein [Tepidisphaeraceae bacterium]
MKLTIHLILLIALFSTSTRAADFALRDNDTVVLLGDSITAEGTWGKILETYTLLCFPDRKIHFINAGQGGDTITGALSRLDRDLFANHATAVIVCFGINDIAWGAKADPAHRQAYLDSTRELIQRCQSHHVRVYFCSAPVTAADPDKSENNYLQKMCDDGISLARSLGESTIDIQRTMRQIQQRVKQANAAEKDEKKRESMHAPDTIHLTDLGETAMAFAVIQGLNAPSLVSSATIDFSSATTTESTNCQISGLKKSDTSLEFTRLDAGLPLNLGLFWGLKFRFIPFPESLNRYLLTIQNLPPGKYTLSASGRPLGTFTSDALSKGVNLSSATADPWLPGGPWDAQGWLVHSLTQSRFLLATTRKYTPNYLKDNQNAPAIDTQTLQASAQLESLQRLTAKPVPYHFVLNIAP